MGINNDEKRGIRITEDNLLVITREDGEERLDFNEMYKGYYPACRFTAASFLNDEFYLAGMQDNGIPVLYSSLGGRTWTEHNLTPKIPVLKSEDYGDIRSILYDDETRQFYLVSEKGCLITLPDCPRCVKARKISDKKILRGEIENGIIRIFDTEGGIIEISAERAAEYRCATEFARKHLKNGGILLDLREEEERKRHPVPKAYPFPPDRVEEIFEKLPKDTPLFFFCEYGYKADEAVRIGRWQGFTKTYSLGGIDDL